MTATPESAPPKSTSKTAPRGQFARGVLGGALVTLAIAAAFEALEHLDVSPLPNPAPILLTAVVYSGFIGGMRAGLLSAAMAFTYLMHVFSTPGHSFSFSNDVIPRITALALASFGMAVMVGLLKHRADRIAKETLEREREHAATLGAALAEREGAAEAARASEERYRTLFEGSLAGVFRVSRDDRLLECNESVLRILGYGSRDEALGDRVRSFYWDSAAQAPLVERLARGEVLINEEVRFRRKDGQPIWVLMSARRVGDGPDAAFEGQIIDITERKIAVEAVAESERRYSELVQEAPDAIISLDLEGRFLSFNPAAERISGYTAQEMLRLHFVEVGLLTEESLGKALEEFQRVVSGEERRPFELRIVAKGGASVVLDAHPRLIRRGGAAAGVQATLRDVTEHRRAEEAERRAEALRSVALLAGAAAHEINNPLAIVSARVQMLMERVGPDSPLHGTLQKVLAAAERIQGIVGRMALITRIETAAGHEGLPPILDIRKSAAGPTSGEPEESEPTREASPGTSGSPG